MLDRLARGALSLVAPPLCPACGEALGRGDALRLCPTCARELPWLTGRPRCGRCALPAPCGPPCPARAAAFAAAWAPVAYAGPASDLVAGLKFRGALAIAELMAAQIAASAPRELLPDDIALVPVPTAPRRVRARGFDHAALLARAIAHRGGQVLVPCLRREGGEGRRAASRQLGAGARERREPGRMAFACTARPPARVALVDDVHTTGATLDAGARTLLRAGAERVVAITYARSL